MPGGEKLTIPAFAAKVKEKYPEYKDVDDTTLTQKIVDKYPEYKDKVDYEIKIAKPLPSQKEQTGFAIDPVGTYKPQSVSMTDYLMGKPIENGLRTTTTNKAGVNIANKVTPSRKPDVKEAIDNAVIDKNKQFGAAQADMSFGRDEITKKVKAGELVPDFDSNGNSVLKSKTGLFDSFVNSLNKAAVERADNANLASMDTDGKIKYLEAKRVIDAQNDNTKAAGVGKLGEFLGENAQVMANTAAGAMTGGALAPELIGASHFGGFLNTVNDFATGGYGNALQKTYNELRQQGMPEKQAMEQAHKEGLVGEATGIATGTVLSGLPKFKADNGVVDEFINTMLKSSAKMGVVSGAGTAANEAGEAVVGVHKNAKDVVNAIGESAANGVAVGAAFEVLLNVHKVPAAIYNQATKVVASIPEGIRTEFLNNAVESGQLPKEKADEINSAVSVVRPEEMNKPREVTVDPKEDIPQEEKALPAIILPENNSKPNIVELGSREKLTGEVSKSVPTDEGQPKGQEGETGLPDVIVGERPAESEVAPSVLKDISNEVTAESNPADQPSDISAKKEVGTNEVAAENMQAAGGGEKPPIVEIAVGDKGQEMVGVTHHAMDKLAEEFGLPDRYDKKGASVEEWDAKATERIKNDEMPALVKKLEAGGDINEVEQRMILQHVAGLKHEYEATKNEKILDEFRRIKKLNDVVGNTWGKVGVARQGQIPPHPLEGGLLSAVVAKEEANGVDKLTDAQRKEVEAQVETYKKAAAEAEAKVAAAEAKNAELLAQKAVESMKKSSTKSVKKTREDYVKERQDIAKSISDKLRQSRGQANNIVTAVVDFAKIAPDVAKLAKSIIEEKISIDLPELVSKVHSVLKDIAPEITENDVRNIISGKHNEKKETKNELQTKWNELQKEQKILNEFDRVSNGEPKTEKAEREKNQKLTTLNKQLDQFKRDKGADQYSDLAAIKRTIAANEKAAEKLKERIANKDFEKEKPIPFSENMELKKKHPELYNDALNAMFKKEEAKHAFDIAQRKDELAKRTGSEKIIDFTRKLAGTTRAIAAGIDDSFALVQAGWTLMTNPKEGAYAFKEHVKDAVSEARFNREMTRLHNSPVWPLVKNSGLDILSPQSLLGKEREDLFVNTFLDTDFKIGGKSFNVGKYTTRPFERAFTSLGNNLRLGLFNKQVQVLYNEGKTFESHRQEFKDAARVINELTGRGKLHPKIEQVSDVITPFIWSPRMIASSMNLLGVSDAASLFIAKKGFYGKLSPSARNMALSQMAKGIGLAASLMAAAAYGGAQVDYDPESVTFGDIKFGNKSYNVFGRYASMIKLVVQVVSGTRKSVTGGEEDLDKRGGHSRIGMVGSYLRGKMTPLSGTAFDAIQHEDYYKHTPVTPGDAAMNVTVPMSMKNLKKGLQQDGTLYLLNDFLPSFFGMTVKDARDFPMGATTGKYGGGGAVGDFLDKNDLTVPMARQKSLTVTSAKRPMTDDEFAKFKVEREKAVTEELTKLMDKGKWVNGVKITLNDEKLTMKQKQELISKAAARATEKAKEAVFGKEKKTMQQKMTDRQDYMKNKMLYK